MNNETKTQGICFGEVLWDNLPEGRKLGGAPLNVAYHLNKLGVHTQMLTRVGNDQDGRDIIALCENLEIPVGLFQLDQSYKTSTVEVHIDENKDVSYEIVFPVAWDFITCSEREIAKVKQADFFVFGSLSTRHDVSYNTLISLLQVAKFKVLDVNLRAPFYSKQRIFELLQLADLVKMNQEEMKIVAEWLGLSHSLSDGDVAEAILKEFSIEEMIVTYGADGSIYYALSSRMRYHFPALKVQVKDTIGSGDSFLAAFLSQRCSKENSLSTEEMLDFAATLSAFVTQQSGGCPPYELKDLNRFKWLTPYYEAKY